MTEFTKKGTIGSILTSSRIISEADIQAALEEQKRSGCRLGEALVRLGVVTQEDVDWALSNQLDIPYIRLKSDLIDRDVVGLIPASVARGFVVIPLFRVDDQLHVAIADPLNRQAIEAIERLTTMTVNVAVALEREIVAMIEELYGPESHETLGFRSAAFSEMVLEMINSDLGCSKLLDCLLIIILKNRLLSLSLQPVAERVVIRGRKADASYEVGHFSVRHHAVIVHLLRQRAGLGGDAAAGRSGWFSFEYRGHAREYQVAFMPASPADYVTLRPGFPDLLPASIDELALPPDTGEAFGTLARSKSGITFFASAGATERNRFVELMLEEMGREDRNVLILGSAVGWKSERYPRISQPDSAVERARQIVMTLEHDLDVLVVEEVEEGPMVVALCRAARRGVRILAGVAVAGAEAAVRYLRHLDAMHPMTDLANGLVTLETVRCLCRSCRVEHVPSADELVALGLERPVAVWYQATGCEACGDSGFAGRRFLVDALPFDGQWRNLVTRIAGLENGQGSQRGAMFRQGLRMVDAGELSPQELQTVMSKAGCLM